MQQALLELKSKICSFDSSGGELHPRLEQLVSNCTVALTAGGEGSRLKHLTDQNNVQKTVLLLPNGETMIERTIAMYKAVGLVNFVALVFHKADSIINLLGDGSRLGVTINYSYDPAAGAGKGGAVKNAYRTGKISQNSYLIVHNPDDQLVGDTARIIKQVFGAHLVYEQKGGLATAVVVEGTNYSFSGLKIDHSLVTEMEMYPFVPIPAHIGMTIFSPGIFVYFDQYIDLTKQSEFESAIFPMLVREKKLYATRVPTDSWIPVNDEKGLKKLIEYLERE